ncbi:translocation/assembly module TamB domain-containing protein [Alicycliphilus denitrificans]|uniref:translocation/assembly module TamB domain-containing protein n=1 Tax=Alicycliphilus denitrificans TaxID=179636 RepID=UPI00384C156E
MTSPYDPQPYAAAAAPQPQAPRRGRWRMVQSLAAGLLVLALALAGALWWWAGSSGSLAATLTRAAQYLPEGQSLQAGEVSGSLRAGGRIGWLRWSSPQLAVEVRDAQISWRLAPLLRRELRIDSLELARLTLTPGAPSSEPSAPLEQLLLPLQVALPFRVQHITWAGPSPIAIDGLTGNYRYDGAQHHLTVDQVALAQGRYALQARLQAAAPMALSARLSGSLQTEVPGSAQPLQAQAQAEVQGQLATADARLEVTARLRGAADTQPPLSADLQARIAPWASQPLLQAAADLQGLDLAALWPQAPATQLSGSASVEPTAHGWAMQARLHNAAPGPWDRQRLPLDSLQAQASYDGQEWAVTEARLQLGKGSASLQGSYRPATQTLQGRAELRALNPAALHSLLDAAPLNGQISADGSDDGAVRFAVDLRAAAARATASSGAALRLDRLTAQGQWQDGRLAIARLQLHALQARLQGQDLHISTAAPSLQGRLQASLPGATAQFDGQIAPQSGKGRLALDLQDAQRSQRWLQALPGMAGASAGWGLEGNAAFSADWQGGWQQLQRQLQAAGLLAGDGQKATAGDGGFALQARLSAPRLQISQPGPEGAAPLALELQHTSATLSGTLAQASLQWDGTLRHVQGPGQPELRARLQLRAEAGQRGAGRWQAQVNALQLQASATGQPGPWALHLAQPLAITLRQAPQLELEATAGQAELSGPAPGKVQLRWQPLHYAQGAAGTQGAARLRSQGELIGLPLAWARAWQIDGHSDGQDALARLGLSGDLVLNGRWDIDAGEHLRASATVERASGDLSLLTGDADAPSVVHSSGQGQAAALPRVGASTPAGLRRAALTLSADGDALRAELDWDSERAGRVQLAGRTSLARTAGGWTWPEDAPLAASVRAELPDVGVWSTLAPPGWRVRGTLSADARLSGTRAAPRWSGQLAAEQFGVRSLLDGVDLQGGRLRATLQGQQLSITELSLHGGQGGRARIAGYSGNRTAAPQDGGTLSGSGSITWGSTGEAGAPGLSGITMDLRARAQALQLLVRADRQLSVSGDLQARLQGGQFTLRGRLKTDRATIILAESGAPRLGADVVVHSAALRRAAAARADKASQASGQVQAARPPDIAITLDLGEDFALQGHGISTRLQGQLEIRSSSATGGQPRVTGELRTVQGRYRAWGQALDVESGLLRFNGPYDNPALDVLALRPNISVRAGVQVTGTARAPRVRLYADPDLPDAEKLSWVVLGRSASAGGAEAALLQQAALAFLGRGGGDGTAGIARHLGLDEIGFKGPQAGADASEAALTLGKRLSKDLYVTYERSLSGVLGTLYIFYDLSKHLTLRGQTGMQSAVDLIYTVRYD